MFSKPVFKVRQHMCNRRSCIDKLSQLKGCEKAGIGLYVQASQAGFVASSWILNFVSPGILMDRHAVEADLQRHS